MPATARRGRYGAHHRILREIYDPLSRKTMTIDIAGDPIAILRFGGTPQISDRQLLAAREFDARWRAVHKDRWYSHGSGSVIAAIGDRAANVWLSSPYTRARPMPEAAASEERTTNQGGPTRPPNIFHWLQRAAWPDYELVRRICCYAEPPRDMAEVKRLRAALNRIARALLRAQSAKWTTAHRAA